VRVRRPMFHRVFLDGDRVMALPRPGTKTAGTVAFEFHYGQEIDISTVSAEAAPGNGGVRLDYLSSPVGRGSFAAALVRHAVGRAGWYVGCRDGFLYALDRAGDLVWQRAGIALGIVTR